MIRSYRSNVYVGYIEKTKVAIKRFSRDYSYDWFCSELEVLSQVRCMNVVSLVGYCYDGHEMILVHEYMSNGSLSDRLHSCNIDNQCLSWKQRLQICIGVAQGLNHLHTGVEGKTIIHGDVKPHNILFGKNWVAKISDINLSLSRYHEVITTTVLEGSLGYLDPEHFLTSRFTIKSDVYSFGVVLLEVLCGREAFLFDEQEKHRFLSKWAIECIEAGSVEEIIDPYLMGKILPLSLSVFVEIASNCLLLRSTERPSMIDVVRKLQLALQLQETADAPLE
ncbi:receptor-like protein kinase FERONIA [Cornus florida]|uniref:receptor-like protein kinase FERONIA n=1 Tax=Cornus florida TaxID=4283 RepID=UPI0028A24D06|nr:receptor-like protein kinase FERONIA [Cornus florida]